MGRHMAAVVTSLNRDKINDNWSNIEIKEIDIPEPKEGQVLIRVHLRPINPTDFFKAGGTYLNIEEAIPFTAGSDGVGTISKLGPGVTGLSVGDRVVVGTLLETWAQYAVADAAVVVRVPDGVSDRVACQFFVNPVTVVGLLDAAAVPEGKWLLQGAGFSSLGRQLVQYARHRGVKTISVVRRNEQIEQLKALGADEVIDSNVEDVVKRVKAIAGPDGAWTVLDPVLGDFTTTALRSVRNGGTVLIYGAMASDEVKFPIMELLQMQRSATGFVMPGWLHKDGPEAARKILENVMELIEQRVLPVEDAGQEFYFKDLHAAIKAHWAPGRTEKIFIKN
eukprot:CAMPEP_0206150012 /NCGR_PEP_ID=MMETSP1473-20131121/38078_1 /ASSEMBLY_ACC=CAM_ASM_001109 /TAXON_ID=1461547 /ORGANISM="Stichococcus sp, Strain RCC1054" /LENGTH=335 /DNA_ID=CAMNT_0053547501 /DNA_START=678 /DNA_END=1685 /DNA_ORIENTATION=-